MAEIKARIKLQVIAKDARILFQHFQPLLDMRVVVEQHVINAEHDVSIRLRHKLLDLRAEVRLRYEVHMWVKLPHFIVGVLEMVSDGGRIGGGIGGRICVRFGVGCRFVEY